MVIPYAKIETDVQYKDNNLKIVTAYKNILSICIMQYDKNNLNLHQYTKNPKQK